MNDKFKPDGTASLSSEPVRGTVERVTFHNPDSGFCVLRVKCRGQRDLVTVVGYAANLNGGEFIEAVGVWRSHAQYGRQLVADRLSVAPPTTIEGMKRFLSSGMIKGIGPVYGQRLVDHFGRAVFDVIDHHPDRLLEVEGIGPVRREKIVASWQEQKKIREIMVFLYEHGVGTAKAVRIYKKYGDLAINLIRENPYRLAQDINGIGFRTADALAMRLGVAKDSIVRARAGVNYALLEEMASGNCAYPRAGLIEKATAILEIPPEITEQAVAVEELEGNLICDRIGNEDCLFLPWLYGAERSIADILRRLTAGRPVWPQIDVIQAINWVDGKLGIALADSQRQAVSKAINAKAMVVTGGPGVGKTTIIRAIIKILEAKNVKILLAAPTGRAARRMSETTGREAKTIHRLLEYDPAQHDFRRNQHNPLDCQLLIVDECSMVDVPLMLLILRAIPSDSALLLVGDVNQLPSVGAGQVLSDIIESGAVPVVTMNEIFRQAETSRIIVGAHAINRGLMPDFSAGPGGDFYFVNSDDPADATEKIITMVRERIPRRWRFDPLRDIQILCPANVGGLGVRNLNQALQQALNGQQAAAVERFGVRYAVGDKVMQIENNYDKDVYNGDLGFISQIDHEEKVMNVEFDGRNVIYSFDELDELVLAYACTIHKSQGSEYPAVVIPLLMQHYMMLQRNLIYTAVTRGRKLVVIVGQKKALAIAIKGKGQNRTRYSKLLEWLQTGWQPGREA